METVERAAAALQAHLRHLWRLVAVVLLVSCSGDQAATPQVEDHGSTAERVELVGAPSELNGQCVGAAEQLGFAVPCPTSLPAGARSTCHVPSEPNPAPCVWGDGFFLQPVVTDVPDGYEGTESGSMHLVITASRDDSGCLLEASQLEQATVRGIEAKLYTCSPHEGLHAGHLLVSWREAGVDFGVSLHGHTDEDRRLVRRIADSVEVVVPPTDAAT